MKTTLNLITHLYNYYTCISAPDISENDKKLHSWYNSEEQTKCLIGRLNECNKFAAAMREPVTETYLVWIMYGIFSKTG